ncbi:MAG: hypothetical protein IJN37_05725 [Clostridia bacterium]|nr:hypothetical protein [Clostridia bacterium]
MIHRVMPFNADLFNSFPVPFYVPRNEIPKEFRANAYGELAMSIISADDLRLYSMPFIF